MQQINRIKNNGCVLVCVCVPGVSSLLFLFICLFNQEAPTPVTSPPPSAYVAVVFLPPWIYFRAL